MIWACIYFKTDKNMQIGWTGECPDEKENNRNYRSWIGARLPVYSCNSLVIVWCTHVHTHTHSHTHRGKAEDETTLSSYHLEANEILPMSTRLLGCWLVFPLTPPHSMGQDAGQNMVGGRGTGTGVLCKVLGFSLVKISKIFSVQRLLALIWNSC